MVSVPSKVKTHSLTLQQAVQENPVLLRLSELTQTTEAQWKAIRPLLPAALSRQVLPSTLENSAWCLLVANSSVGSKLKQMLPELLQQLNAQGFALQSIRIKVSPAAFA